MTQIPLNTDVQWTTVSIDVRKGENYFIYSGDRWFELRVRVDKMNTLAVFVWFKEYSGMNSIEAI